MAKVRTFRDLIAWQKAMDLAQVTYRCTERMPVSEQFGLTHQMRRAAVSIPSNTAEGHARQSRGDYLKHLRIARASLAELFTQYELAVRLTMLTRNQIMTDLLEEEDRILQALIRSLEQKTE